MPRTRLSAIPATACKRATEVLMLALVAAPAGAQLSQLEVADVAAQQRTMDYYESLLGRMIEARQRGQCSEFRDIRDLQLTDLAADAAAVRVSPEWRRDFERRVDAAGGQPCSPSAAPGAVPPPSQGQDRFAAQINIIREAQAQGACGPYQTFQSVLLEEIETIGASDRLELAGVLALGCTPAADSPWDPVAPVRLAADSEESALDELPATVSLLDRGEDPLLEQARSDFVPVRQGCDQAAFEAARRNYLDRIEDAERRIRGDTPYRRELLSEETAVAVMKRPECTAESRRAARAAYEAGRTSCERATFERAMAIYAGVIELALRNVEAAGGYADSPVREALLREELDVAMAEFTPCEAPGLDWLVGVWRIPERGGAVGFRLEADGTASGYIAEATDALSEAGYSAGQVVLRGCKDVSANNTVVWRYSANCVEGFRESWQGGGIVLIRPGETGLELPTYIGNPIAGYAKLERTGAPASAPARPPNSTLTPPDDTSLRLQREAQMPVTLARGRALGALAVEAGGRHVSAAQRCDLASMKRESDEIERLLREFSQIERGDVDFVIWTRIGDALLHERYQASGRQPRNCR